MDSNFPPLANLGSFMMLLVRRISASMWLQEVQSHSCKTAVVECTKAADHLVSLGDLQLVWIELETATEVYTVVSIFGKCFYMFFKENLCGLSQNLVNHISRQHFLDIRDLKSYLDWQHFEWFLLQSQVCGSLTVRLNVFMLQILCNWWHSSGFAFSLTPSPQNFSAEDGWSFPFGYQWDRQWLDVLCGFWSLL